MRARNLKRSENILLNLFSYTFWFYQRRPWNDPRCAKWLPLSWGCWRWASICCQFKSQKGCWWGGRWRSVLTKFASPRASTGSLSGVIPLSSPNRLLIPLGCSGKGPLIPLLIGLTPAYDPRCAFAPSSIVESERNTKNFIFSPNSKLDSTLQQTSSSTSIWR